MSCGLRLGHKVASRHVGRIRLSSKGWLRAELQMKPAWLQYFTVLYGMEHGAYEPDILLQCVPAPYIRYTSILIVILINSIKIVVRCVTVYECVQYT